MTWTRIQRQTTMRILRKQTTFRIESVVSQIAPFITHVLSTGWMQNDSEEIMDVIFDKSKSTLSH